MERIYQERTEGWLSKQLKEINSSLERLLSEWGLNKSLEQLDDSGKKRATFVLETEMAAYGLNFDDGALDQIVAGFYPHLEDGLKGSLTVNHNSLAVRVYGGDISTPVKYAPVLAGACEIGSISPLKVGLAEADGLHILNFKLGDKVSWQLKVDFVQPPPHAVTQFEFAGEKPFLGKKFVDACCSTSKGGIVLADSHHPCEQGCTFCSYDRGKLELNPDNFTKLGQVLEFIAKTTGKITACFSSGSSFSPDRGIPAVFGPMLAIVDILKAKYPHLKTEIELELMPWEINADESVLAMIDKYYQKGYVKAVNMNLETPIGVDRDEFMNSQSHGKGQIPIVGYNGKNRGYLETFCLLKKYFPDLQLAGLILFGLKPKPDFFGGGSYPMYLSQCIRTVEIFAQDGVKILFQPLKISSKTPMATYPLVDPFWLAGGVLMADDIHMKYGLDAKHRVGCVNGCDACDSSRSGYSLLRYYKHQFGDEGVHQLLFPWHNQTLAFK